jgi:glycosyltransferase involved in cell wall biosynthesis
MRSTTENRPVVCFLNSVKTWGGGEKWHFEMALNLHRSGHNIHFIAAKNSVLARKLKKTDIKVNYVSIGNLSFLNPFKILLLRSIFREKETDYLIMNISADIKSAGIAAKLAGVKRIIYRRGSAIPIRNTFFNRYLFKNILTDVIANSEATKLTINKNNPSMFPAGRINVIYNGLDPDLYKQISGKRNFNEDVYILGFLARLVPQKGLEYLIEIAKYLRDHAFVKFKILIGGEGPQKEELEKSIIENSLQEYVLFMGFIDDTASFLASLDIFLLTSKWEGFGFVLAEAMLQKKPIVAWNISSNPELVVHGENGYLAPPYNIEVFSKYVLELIYNKEKRKEFGQYGYAHTLKNFTMQNSINQLCSFLNI